VGCQEEPAVLWQCGGCGPDSGSGPEPIRRIEDGGETERDPSHGEGGCSVRREAAGLVPQKEEDGMAGDSEADGPRSPGEYGDVIVYETGARRSNIAERYDLIPPDALSSVARVMAKGAKRHGENNWQRGMPPEVCVNHAIRHLYLWLQGDKSEPHAAHAAANCLMLIALEAKNQRRV